MIGYFVLMIIFGGMFFMAFGLIAANSVDEIDNKRDENVSAVLSLMGLAFFVIGFIGAVIVS